VGFQGGEGVEEPGGRLGYSLPPDFLTQGDGSSRSRLRGWSLFSLNAVFGVEEGRLPLTRLHVSFEHDVVVLCVR